MLQLKAQSCLHLLRFFLPTIALVSSMTIASHPAQANCSDDRRSIEKVKQCVPQLKNDPDQLFGKKILDAVKNRQIPLTSSFDRWIGSEKRQDTQAALSNPWLRLLGKISAPLGWSATACDGQAPFLCVYRNKLYVGSIQLLRWEYRNFPILQAQFKKLGLVPGRITYSNPNDKAKVLTVLKAVIADYYKTIETDRMTTYGKTYKVQVQQPEEVKVGTLPGLKYGFKGIDRTGLIREQYVSYIAFDGKLNIIVTGYDPAANTNVLKDLDSLRRFEPHLKTIVENLKLSDSER
jgi:hypothetical protein